MKLQELVSGLSLALRSIFCLAISCFSDLPGRRFDWYGRRLVLRNKIGSNRTKLLLNPVSSVRYFEFDFVGRHIPTTEGQQILDVASPVLFGLYLSEDLKCQYRYINLDGREISELDSLLVAVRVRGRYEASMCDVLQMPDMDESYDTVVSISVIEHIPGEGDTHALLEMWRVLRPGGRLILTFPVSGAYEEEYREQDQYQVGLPREEQGYFFQRYYDDATMRSRLLQQLPGATVIATEFYGERGPGFFRDYEDFWIANGLKVTVKDPYLMARYMMRFSEIGEMPGIGVAGVCIEKGPDDEGET